MIEAGGAGQEIHRWSLHGWRTARPDAWTIHPDCRPHSVEAGASHPAVVPAKLRIPRGDGLRRERLLTLLDGAWSHRLSLVTAPPGCGKTTLLSQFATASAVPVGWYRAEPSDGDPVVFLAHLEASARCALGALDGPWLSAGDAARALERGGGGGLLLVIDDLHVLGGTAAELELERLLGYLPEDVTIVAASRAHPRINTSRLRLVGSLLELGQDALRFRTWEVEHLFRDVYGEPLRPEELAELARRTDGWAAGLQLFHLATRGKAPDDRRRTLRALGTHSRLVREYLARNVLSELDAETRTFLLRTSVFGRLSGGLCDRFLERHDSGSVLAELQHQQLFTDLIDDEGWYRYHAVLRSHLETMAVEEMGEAAVREQRRRAGTLLEEVAAFADALEAYCSAGAWADAARLLGVRGEELVDDPGGWIDLMPPSMVEENPWVLLAAARRHLAAGRCRSAVDAYRRAETTFGDLATADVCRRERASLAAWTDVGANFSADWPGLLRAATRRDPMAVSGLAMHGEGAGDHLVAGLAALLAGRLDAAGCVLIDLLGREELTPAVGLCARLGAAVASALGAPSNGVSPERVAEELEHAGFPWLDRLGRAVLAATGQQAAVLEPMGTDVEDRWGQPLRALLVSWGEVRRGRGDPARLGGVVAAFHTLDAPVLEAWALGLLALAQRHCGHPAAELTAHRARAMADCIGVPGARALALAASGDEDDRLAAVALAEECGIELPLPAAGDARGAADRADRSTPPSVVITCLGGFSVSLGGRPLDLGTVKPRVRSLLRMFALHPGVPLHRDVITTALWPEADSDTGTRNLQVAVSALRRLLGKVVGPASRMLVLREGEAYRLALPDDAVVDVAVFERAISAGRECRRKGDLDGAVTALEEALAVSSTELLPEEGPADWLIAARERHVANLVDAALALATIHAQRGDLVLAAAACERALVIDRYSDATWALLVEIHSRAGNDAAGARVQQRYAAMLRELGIVSSVSA
jgi:DNA-binding SARP family transcriptional activator